jgi:hypothetical protein
MVMIQFEINDKLHGKNVVLFCIGMDTMYVKQCDCQSTACDSSFKVCST